ncbi:MAG: sialate O-acetylesterase, partial [Bryobacterales bacterium]|nr:sialate O-acetylesterase [Bryobacterales bacterium]
MRRNLITLFASLLMVAAAVAEVRLPNFFADNMVLQRDLPCPVWGEAIPGETVTVSFRGQTMSTQADDAGQWRITLAPTAAGTPFELKVAGAANTITIQNVAVGEVWVASGQSNMGWPLRLSNDAEKEIAASTFPGIRFFQAAKTVALTPQLNVKGAWKASAPAVSGDFSGVAYFFARHLHQKLGVPVGILQTEWGGTPAEAWTSAGALAADPALRQVFVDWANTLAAFPRENAKYP